MKHTETEQAYRRGVFHGLHALKEFLDKNPGNPFGAEACLDAAVSHARMMRVEDGALGWYTHELINRIRAEIDDHDEFYAKAECS